ncbi:aminotransferase class IV family protein [Nocardia puris]|uniref:aminotransferase class IV family protein n=1 Tax=Nocardia puris TaxID=208602 RepID=UPI001E46962E|nr:aminotransferase class IV family protein [Nocardia puris]
MLSSLVGDRRGGNCHKTAPCLAQPCLLTRTAGEGGVGACHTGRMDLNGSPVTAADLAPLGLVGFGHFTSMRVETGPAVRGLTLHLDRVIQDCRTVFHTELDPDRVRELLRRALTEVELPVIARVTVFDPAIELGKTGSPADPQVLITTRPATNVAPGPLRLQSAVYARDVPNVKHLGLFGAMHHRAQAQRAGFDDVVFTTPDGTVSEIATSNIAFITPEGTLVWPHADVLAGTTMRLIHQVLDEPVTTERVTLSQLGVFAGAIATNAAVGVRPVASIDDIEWKSDHPLIAAVRGEYEAIPAQRI